MNSLEFIDRKIKQLEERKEKAFKNEYYSIYKECSQKITALHQIKAELEAWYVVKDMVEIKRGEILDHILRIKKGAIDHDEYRKLKKVGFK